MRVIPGRGCVCGVVGFVRAWSASCAPVVLWLAESAWNRLP